MRWFTLFFNLLADYFSSLSSQGIGFEPFLIFFLWGSFQKMLPFCMREVWILTACLGLINATSSHYRDGLVSPDMEKEFYRVQGDIYSLCRVKVNSFMFYS